MPRLREDDIITPTLLKRWQDEAEFEHGDGRHFGLILRDDNHSLIAHTRGPALSPDQMLWAGTILRMLNTELHHDGAWVIVFTHPMPPKLETVLHNPTHCEYGRYAFIFLDQDGDPQFTMEWETGITSDLKDFAAIVEQGPLATCTKAEMAWVEWSESRRALELRPGETFKKAKGQAPSNARH